MADEFEECQIALDKSIELAAEGREDVKIKFCIGMRLICI